MAKPKLALIPAAQGSKFYSVLPSNGVGDFQFSRSGSATRISAQGLIETVANGVSRLNYPLIDGVVSGCPHHILEPQRTQKVQYSEDFNQSYWAKTTSTITSNSVISPDGTLNADKLIPSASNNIHKIGRDLGSVTGDYTFSIFAKKGEYKNILLWDDNLSEGIGVNLDDLSVFRNVGNDGYNIENYGNGWIRISLTLNYSAQAIRFAVYVYDNSNQITFLGNGTDGIYIYGAQIEQGSYPTSYIPNYGTSAGVTRSAETANGSGDAATFNDSEGVLMAEISALANDGTNRRISISDGTTSNRLLLSYNSTSNQIQSFLANPTVQFNFYHTLSNSIEFNKIAVKYKQNDFALWINGVKVETDTNGTIANGLNTLNFDEGSGASDFYGNTKQIQYFDTALNDSDLETLTSWTSFTDLANGQLYSIK